VQRRLRSRRVSTRRYLLETSPERRPRWTIHLEFIGARYGGSERKEAEGYNVEKSTLVNECLQPTHALRVRHRSGYRRQVLLDLSNNGTARDHDKHRDLARIVLWFLAQLELEVRCAIHQERLPNPGCADHLCEDARQSFL
jgi:hypothetical protein